MSFHFKDQRALRCSDLEQIAELLESDWTGQDGVAANDRTARRQLDRTLEVIASKQAVRKFKRMGPNEEAEAIVEISARLQQIIQGFSAIAVRIAAAMGNRRGTVATNRGPEGAGKASTGAEAAELSPTPEGTIFYRRRWR